MTVVTINHARDVFGTRYCHRGMRLFCARNNLDWSDIVKNGVSSERLRATGDAMAIRLADAADRVKES